MSSSYERMNYITSFGFSLRWRKQFLETISPSNQKLLVIDLLSGMGETWSLLKKRFPNASFTAIDFSEGMTQYAQKKNLKRGYSIEIIKEDILSNHLPSNTFDIAVSAFGLKTFNQEQLEILAGELKRILKTNGQFAFIEVSEPRNPFLHFLYKIHLKYVVPFCGRLMLGNPEEYRMLWTYTTAFQDARQALEIFEKAGLEVHYRNYFWGCASGIYGRKTNPK